MMYICTCVAGTMQYPESPVLYHFPEEHDSDGSRHVFQLQLNDRLRRLMAFQFVVASEIGANSLAATHI